MYIIKCWIPIKPEYNKIYTTFEEAQRDLEELELMQIENIYMIEKI